MTDKDLLWEAYWNGYKQGYGVEEMSELDERAARDRFDQWYDSNVAEDEGN